MGKRDTAAWAQKGNLKFQVQLRPSPGCGRCQGFQFQAGLRCQAVQGLSVTPGPLNSCRTNSDRPFSAFICNVGPGCLVCQPGSDCQRPACQQAGCSALSPLQWAFIKVVRRQLQNEAAWPDIISRGANKSQQASRLAAGSASGRD